MKEKLELRMYGLVPYNISEIQKGIQFGHAVVEYGQMIKNKKVSDDVVKEYDTWANEFKTFIILNGGTSNHTINRYSDDDPIGTMESNLKCLNDSGIITSEFYEPDLNDMLSAIVFIVDERVFNKKDYPDFEDWVIENYGDLLKEDPSNWKTSGKSSYQLASLIKNSESPRDKKVYKKWVNLVGGEKNVFLRDFLKNFRLA
jgi:hypothetical protein